MPRNIFTFCVMKCGTMGIYKWRFIITSFWIFLTITIMSIILTRCDCTGIRNICGCEENLDVIVQNGTKICSKGNVERECTLTWSWALLNSFFVDILLFFCVFFIVCIIIITIICIVLFFDLVCYSIKCTQGTYSDYKAYIQQYDHRPNDQEMSSTSTLQRQNPDLEEYKKAKEIIKRLENHPQIVEWINLEGQCKVEEYFNIAVNNFKEQYPILTDDDIDWIRNDFNEIHITFDSDNNGVKVDKFLKNSQNSQNSVMIINRSHLLPMEMTHLWGGGLRAFQQS